jgi:hypothetical protein
VDASSGALGTQLPPVFGGAVTSLIFDGESVWAGYDNGYLVGDGGLAGYFILGLFGSKINALVFDGDHIWAGQDDGTLSVIIFSAEPEAIEIPDLAGGSISALVFDGSYVWAADSASDMLAKFDASDFSLLTEAPAVVDPAGLSFDGANIWLVSTEANSIALQ